ncbi:MAG: hypothetical protein P8O89_05590 [Polaribacter sp.]|nr:hypothetical protein [Polaribacter sp.]
METIKRITAAAFILASLIGYANEDKKTTNNKAKKTVKLVFNNVKKGQILSIRDEQGFELYNNKIKNSGNYSKIFDFSALEDGIYSAELNKDFKIITKKVIVKNGLVTFLNNKNKTEFKPVIRTKNNLLYISKLALNPESIKITIYYKETAIFSETLKDKKNLKRIYKLSKNEIGKYKVIIDTKDRYFVKDFTL